MHKFFQCSLIAVMALGSLSAYCDVPIDTVRLNEVVVSDISLTQFSTGNKIEVLNKNLLASYHHTNLGDLLLQASQLNVSSYGALSNVSMRGTGSSHTAVLWNGFNIQNTLNGGVNMTLIPVGFMDDVRIQYGGCSALFGSGAIGGIIHLNNVLAYNKGVSAQVDGSLGSFGMQQTSASVRYSNARYAGSIRMTEQSAKNNFTFKNTAEYLSPLDTQKNASMKGYGVMLDNQFKLNQRHQLISHVWLQDYHQEIPTPIVQAQAFGKQRSTDLRGSLEYQYSMAHTEMYIRTAFLNERMGYSSLIDTGDHRIKTLISEMEGRTKLGTNHTLRYGTNYSREQGRSNYFEEIHLRNRNALFASYKISNNKQNISGMLNIRQELINGRATPLTYSAGIQAYLSSFQIKANFSRNYKLPSFNDLYWNVWGNPNLKSEQGYSLDGGFIYSIKNNRFSLSVGQTYYAGVTNNLIVWQPSGSVWHPFNINNALMRGIENEIKTSYVRNETSIECSINYAYASSINKGEEFSIKNSFVNSSKDYQIIYIPKHKLAGRIFYFYKTFGISYIHSLSSKRYINTDNTLFVDGYSTAKIIISKKIIIAKTSTKISFHVNNIYNETYQVMAWYPMPGRHYQLSVSFNFN